MTHLPQPARRFSPATGVPVVDQVDHFRARLVQDALSEAVSSTWIRRAIAFETAGPRTTDYLGQATHQDRADRSVRCAGIARACRARATHPHQLTDREARVDEWLSPTAQPFSEPVESMIARHQRVIAAVEQMYRRTEAA